MTNFNASSFRFFERKVAQGIALSDFSGSLLYHTKNYQGTTTSKPGLLTTVRLYHTKNYQGATTQSYNNLPQYTLYHTKNCQGTTTRQGLLRQSEALYHTRELQPESADGPDEAELYPARISRSELPRCCSAILVLLFSSEVGIIVSEG